ncbi:MAG: M23 family metallopeptidase, partial [Alphaproteobacteria bacterium]|nr:M23 family metallopeptidase [Alphaproteobacteria bacterium]
SAGVFGPPISGDIKIGSDFGKRTPVNTGNGTGSTYHKGVDIKAAAGTPLYAVAAGRVIIAGSSKTAGNWVRIEHSFSGTNKKVYTEYMHMNTIAVKNGQMVQKGQQIGTAGNTGRSKFAHLHYGVRFGGVAVDPLGAAAKPVLINDTQSNNAHVSRGNNYLGGPYCFKSGISSPRLEPYKNNESKLKADFPGCTGWCKSY